MKSLTIIMKGNLPNRRAFLHLPHGKDCAFNIDAIGHGPWYEILKTQGNLRLQACNQNCQKAGRHMNNCTDIRALARDIFVSALSFIRRECTGARFEGESNPDTDQNNF